MIPQPWSHSRLEDFKNCPRAFSEKTVFKTVTETKGEATLWGERVHKHFEEYLTGTAALPPELEMHKPFLDRLLALPGNHFVEEKIALDTSLRPCTFFGKDVWFRGVIDFGVIEGAYARVVDHKSGKHHAKFDQLKLFALWLFEAHPAVEQVRCEYYWTQTMTTNGRTFDRGQIQSLWEDFLPDLHQYKDAFLTDTWQPRQSGLCRGWCPVTSCEFWQPKRMRG